MWGGYAIKKKSKYVPEELKKLNKNYDKIRIDNDYTDLNGIRKFGYILLNDQKVKEIIYYLHMTMDMSNAVLEIPLPTIYNHCQQD